MKQDDVSSSSVFPIGVFDSGVGGLSVMRALITRLPSQDYIYVADSANCPYGSRSANEILAFSEGISRYLVACGVRLIVVACNTASGVALSPLRKSFPQIPFVGIVPAVKPAAQQTHTGVVGVLATPTTLNGQLYKDVVDHYALGVRVVSQPCRGLVEQVEAGDLDSPRTVHLLQECVNPLIAAGADTLVLGCTHYPFLIPALRRVIGEEMLVLEPSEAIARQTEHLLRQDGLLYTGKRQGGVQFYTTGDVEHFAVVLKRLLSHGGSVHHLAWDQGRLVDGMSWALEDEGIRPRSLVC